MTNVDFRPRRPNGWQLTEREEAICEVDGAVYGLASIFGRDEAAELNAALFRLTDGHARRMTTAMLRDLASVLRLTRKLAADVSIVGGGASDAR